MFQCNLISHLPSVLPSGLFSAMVTKAFMLFSVCSTWLVHSVFLDFINKIFLASSIHLEASCYVIFATFFSFLSIRTNPLTQTPFNNKHGGAATEFITQSAGLSTKYRCHNDECTVWSIVFHNYRWRFILKLMELTCDETNYNFPSADFYKMVQFSREMYNKVFK